MKRKSADIKPIKKEVVKTPAPKPFIPRIAEPPPPRQDGTLIKALTQAVSRPIDSPQLAEILARLSQPAAPQRDKRLVINRDNNGLIQSIDIKEI